MAVTARQLDKEAIRAFCDHEVAVEVGVGPGDQLHVRPVRFCQAAGEDLVGVAVKAAIHMEQAAIVVRGLF
eukprot:991990-Heterocapsa_arctica.AAC.1